MGTGGRKRPARRGTGGSDRPVWGRRRALGADGNCPRRMENSPSRGENCSRCGETCSRPVESCPGGGEKFPRRVAICSRPGVTWSQAVANSPSRVESCSRAVGGGGGRLVVEVEERLALDEGEQDRAECRGLLVEEDGLGKVALLRALPEPQHRDRPGPTGVGVERFELPGAGEVGFRRAASRGSAGGSSAPRRPS
jgi:hypothetical protein